MNCDRIFRAKRQLSLIPLNRMAALPAALSNLTRPQDFELWLEGWNAVKRAERVIKSINTQVSEGNIVSACIWFMF